MVWAQKETELKFSGRTGTKFVRGYVGGESHDLYSISLFSGRTVTVAISAKESRADLLVSEPTDFSEAKPAPFGKDAPKGLSPKGESWSGVVPNSRTFYIYVTAYPAAHYRLKVRVK